MFKFRKKREKGHEYNLTYDNLAVPRSIHMNRRMRQMKMKKAGNYL